jgi:hypothetical protein
MSKRADPREGAFWRQLVNYKVHRFNLKMTRDGKSLERFLNSLDGEVVSIIPNVTIKVFWVHQIDFVLVVEKLP